MGAENHFRLSYCDFTTYCHYFNYKQMKATKKQPKNPKTWNFEKEVYYKCKKCGGWFLLENFNLEKQMCKKCLKKYYPYENSADL